MRKHFAGSTVLLFSFRIGLISWYISQGRASLRRLKTLSEFKWKNFYKGFEVIYIWLEFDEYKATVNKCNHLFELKVSRIDYHNR